MKIFPKPTATSKPDSKPESKTSKTASKESRISAQKKADLPAKKEMSASDIKEKLAAHVDTSDAAKNMAIRNSKKLGEGFMNDEIKPAPIIEPISSDAPVAKEVKEVGEEKSPNSKDFVLKSDIAANDPKDTNTQEKLKTALSKGAFSFNPKEREALEKILGS